MKTFTWIILGFQLIGFLSSLSKGRHPCDRKCEVNKTKICEYTFYVEWYYTMSRSCGDCPTNISDCSRKYCIHADGVDRAVMAVNRAIPGPQIRVCENDTVIVNVSNHLKNLEGLSIHWHGIDQKNTNKRDGVALLTECPIARFDTYNFTAFPSGTHWWHSHSGLQRSDGISGAFIIKRPKEFDPNGNLYNIDSPDHVVLISDWLHNLTIDKFSEALHDKRFISRDIGDNILINGKGISETGVGYNNSILREVFNVESEETYRFRIINNGAFFCSLRVTIDNHTLTIISTDGSDVEPFTVTHIEIQAAERFDFILTADQRVDSYWFRVIGQNGCKGQEQTAILRYKESNADQNPTTQQFQLKDVEYKVINPIFPNVTAKEYPLNSLKFMESNSYPPIPRLEDEPDNVIFLGLDFLSKSYEAISGSYFYPVISNQSMEDNIFIPTINNVSFMFPDVSLFPNSDDAIKEFLCTAVPGDDNIKNKEQFCRKTFCSCTNVYNLTFGDLVEVVFFGEGKSNSNRVAGHPFHLHGFHFSVVAMEHVNDTLPWHEMKEIYNTKNIKYNFTTAPRKDTIIVPDGGYTVVRFIADNPGLWFLHCHFEFHLNLGMAAVFHVGDPDKPLTEPHFPKCINNNNSDKCPSPPPSPIPYSHWTTVAVVFILTTIICIIIIIFCGYMHWRNR